MPKLCWVFASPTVSFREKVRPGTGLETSLGHETTEPLHQPW